MGIFAKKVKIVLLSALSVGMFYMCVKPFNPDIDKYERILVVDGILTDFGNKAEVKLSFSFKVEKRVAESVSGAAVSVENSGGKRFDLLEDEKEKGVYRYIGLEQIGMVGESYKLVILYDGLRYESSLDKMLPVADIDDIKLGRDPNKPEEGVQLLLSSKGDGNDSRYYAWVLDETWKFQVPLYAPRFKDKQVCWAHSETSGIVVGNTVSNSNNEYKDYAFYFIDVLSARLTIRYSALVNQMSISNETYQYLNHVKEVNTSNGSLFDPVPASMNGNVACVDDPNVPVIGNFQVSAVSTKRIYIDRNDIPDLTKFQTIFDNCVEYRVLTTDTRTQDSLDGVGYIIVDTPKIEQLYYYRYSYGAYCFDCTATGAEVTPPDWWEN